MMRIIAIKPLKEFVSKYPDAQNAIELWYHRVKEANWKNPNEVKFDFNSADLLPNGRIVFDIKGNKYRLVTLVKYCKKNSIVYVRFIGTHKEYDKIDAKTI